MTEFSISGACDDTSLTDKYRTGATLPCCAVAGINRRKRAETSVANGAFYFRFSSLDDLIRSCQYVLRDRQTDLLRGFKINDELEFGWLLNRQVAGFGAL